MPNINEELLAALETTVARLKQWMERDGISKRYIDDSLIEERQLIARAKAISSRSAV